LETEPSPLTAAAISRTTVRPTMPMISAPTAEPLISAVMRVESTISSACAASVRIVTSCALPVVASMPNSGMNACVAKP
jgi:hypothetical protein